MHWKRTRRTPLRQEVQRVSADIPWVPRRFGWPLHTRGTVSVDSALLERDA